MQSWPRVSDSRRSLCNAQAATAAGLKHLRRPLGHDRDAVFQSMLSRTGTQALDRFLQRLVAQAEAAVMHGHHPFRAQIKKRLDRLLWVHVHIPPRRRVVGADWEQSDVDLVTRADLAKSIEIRRVAAMEHG